MYLRQGSFSIECLFDKVKRYAVFIAKVEKGLADNLSKLWRHFE